jgi:ubiquinone/menaquinone biosynthesis C-methylase UbiE
VTHSGADFDQYAADYDRTIDRAIRVSGETVQYFAALRAQMLAAAVGSDADRTPHRILDFGCGTGNLTREVAKLFVTSTLTGTDASAESLAQARARTNSSQIAYVVTPSGELAFEPRSFDVAYAQGVFHHIEPNDRLHWAREIRRALTPGGQFFLFEHNPLNPLTRRVVRNTPFDEGVVLLWPRSATQMMHDAGFRSVAAAHYYFFFPRFLRRLRPLERWMTRFVIGAQYMLQATA